MTDRRTFVYAGALALLAAPLRAGAQRTGALPRIGFLTPGNNPREPAFWQGMRDLGYVEGKNIVVDRRSAKGDLALLPALAAEIVKHRPDVIVALVTASSIAAQKATSTIPIVMVGVSDPVVAGLVGNLARPSGNITGTVSQTYAVVGKLVELIRQLLPSAARVTVLWDPIRHFAAAVAGRDAHRGRALARSGDRSAGRIDRGEYTAARWGRGAAWRCSGELADEIGHPVMKRHSGFLLLAIIAICTSTAAWPQQPGRLPKVGILSPGKQVDMGCASTLQGVGPGCFLEGLRALGYDDGRNVALEYRFAEGAPERLPALAVELVSLRPDVIYTFTASGADAAAGATSTIPIVVGPAGERTLERLAGTFARPVGNVTGVTLNNLEQDQKCLQLLKELAPRTSRVAVLLSPDNSNNEGYPGNLRHAANQLGITLTRIDARNVADLPQAFAMISASGADAIFMVDDAALAGTPDARKRIIEWALGRRLPLASSSWRVAPDGGLVSLGTVNSPLSRRAAYYVDRLLRGAKPADLPVERPTTYKLSVNRKTAMALGLTVPQSLLLRADEVL